MKRMPVQVKNLKIGCGHPIRVMGVANLSPESFYKGSTVTTEEDLITYIKEMEREGADIIDVGAASTSPKNIYSRTDTNIEEEYQRINGLLGSVTENTKLPVSIDTTSARVAESALNLGASMINDVSGMQADKNMAHLVSEHSVPIVLMANCQNPCMSLDQSLSALKTSLRIAEKSKIDRNMIIIDPGIGFGKPTDVDLSFIRNLGAFRHLGFPLLVGVSRKAFIGDLLKLPNPNDRLVGSIAASAIAAAYGADIIRTHDVKETVSSSKIGGKLQRREYIEDEGIYLLEIRNEREGEIILEEIGVREEIRPTLARKSFTLGILLKDMKIPSALIIKQEMLALGGDAAYHHDTIDFGVKSTDILIMGTKLQLNRLVRRLKTMDYFGLDRIGNAIQNLLRKHGEK